MSAFINSCCEFVDWSSPLIDNCPEFSCCHDKNIENFFKSEFADYDNQLLGKSYGFVQTKPSLEPEYKRTRLMYFDLIVLKS